MSRHAFSGLLAGKTALITGGAGGIGSEMCRVFAEAGARVFFCDIALDRARRLEADLLAAGLPVHFIPADVTSAEQVQLMVQQITGDQGPLHILVNNAGISGRPLGDGPVTECSEAAWQRVLDVNLTGPYLVSRYAVPAIIRAGGGAVVHISSDDALVGPLPPYDTHAYCASKGGLIALTKAMAISYAPYRVRVNAIAPGWVASPMTADLHQDPAKHAELVARHPLGRLGTPRDIAMAALFLASDAAGFITGVVLPVEGGATSW
ncbi:MAG: hypothetical protein BAA04_07155 [Firmicutes bacterium ZCTH02-B6]|nr:MAG: hypothetical protein BAA04_07155 [Firmicutes bacterium ZCTH02-B6]